VSELRETCFNLPNAINAKREQDTGGLMRHAIISILKAIRMADGKESAIAAPTIPMMLLNAHELREVVGGDDPNLPKGGWKPV